MYEASTCTVDKIFDCQPEGSGFHPRPRFERRVTPVFGSVS